MSDFWQTITSTISGFWQKVISGMSGLFQQTSANDGKTYFYNNNKINKVIDSGIAQGLSIPHIAENLMKAIKDLDMVSAVRMARTSVTSAQNSARYNKRIEENEALAKYGLKCRHQWVATHDERTRDSHAHIDGEIRDVGELFSNGCRYPGDPEGAPSEVYNCRCTTITVMEGLTDDIYTSSKDYQDYHSWWNDQHFNSVDTPTYVDALDEAKSTLDKEIAFRVTSYDSPQQFDEYHPDAVKYVTKCGSTVAITKDGDIVAVCHKNGGMIKGKELMAYAVKHGGVKLDSFEGNFGFYLKCGFEPVSWCKWDENEKPNDWDPAINKREDVIFFIYTGRKFSEKEVKQIVSTWKTEMPASADYSAAQKMRDSLVDTYLAQSKKEPAKQYFYG